MPHQKSIKGYFSAAEGNQKRSLKQVSDTSAECKKQKLEELESESSLSDKEEGIDTNKTGEQISITFGEDKVSIGKSWEVVIVPELQKLYFQKLDRFLVNERKTHVIYPTKQDVFCWSLQHKLQDTKVVILGQDPYHGLNQAHGLCFSVQKGVRVPPSLKNIYKELAKEYDDFEIPEHGYLSKWAEQGVLLLNAVLTVRASKANSHKDKGWEKFTDAVIRWISNNLDGVVFMLWGSYAHKKGSNINKNRHCILKSVHPSPLSAHNGWFGCKHFVKANEYLEKVKKKPIMWDCL